MNQSITEMHGLLKEIAELLQSGKKVEKRKAVVHLKRIAAIASTAALVLGSRC